MSYELTDTLQKKARVLALAGDPTRLRILCFMFEHQEACVSEIAEALDMSVASISHHLQLMREQGFFATERMGTKICYKLSESDCIHHIKNFVCDNAQV